MGHGSREGKQKLTFREGSKAATQSLDSVHGGWGTSLGHSDHSEGKATGGKARSNRGGSLRLPSSSVGPRSPPNG